VDPSLRLQPDTLARLSQAKDYLYDIPQSSFAFLAGRTLPLISVDLQSPLDSQVLDEGRVCTLRACAVNSGVSSRQFAAPPMLLLAYGSNASLEGLSRKFSRRKEAAALPVARATLQDFDIVYSSHISPYGAIPAALQYCPGARTAVHVLVATEAQRRLLRETEPNYIFAQLSHIGVQLDLGPTLSSIGVFLTRHGMLTHEGAELGVAAVQTESRRYPSITEERALGVARDLTAPGLDIDSFILENVNDVSLSRRRTERLKVAARPFAYGDWEEIHE